MTCKSLLLAGAALIVCASPPPVSALGDRIELAQFAPDKDKKEEKENKPEPGKAAPPQQRPAPPAPPPQQPHPQAAPPAPPQQPRPAQVAPPPAPPRHEERPAAAPPPAPPREQRPTQVPPPAAQQPQRPVQAPAPFAPPHEPPRATQVPVPAPQQQQPQQPAQAPAQPGQQRPTEGTPPGAPGRQQAQPPAPAGQPAPPQQTQTAPQGPRGFGQPQQQPAQTAPAALPPAAAAPPPPQQPRDASQFIRQPGQAPTRTIQDLRQERQQVQQGDTTIIREGDRTIVRQGDRTIIRHQEADRFAVGARDVRTERRGDETVTVIVRPNGDQIVTVIDLEGRLIRRVRREPNGREIVIIDEDFAGPRREDFFIDRPPPRLSLPPDRYYVELDRAPPQRIFETLIAPPFERFEGRYTVGQVRYGASLRMLMRRIDLDINFDTGSWSLTPDQIDRLSVIADAMKRAIDRNPREVFLVEGHTDAVGNDEDNLSLSDRRAESVAVALTQEFGVPPENMVTQGYGKQELKVPTTEPSRENRRVAVRRITPLLEGYARR